MVVPLRKKTLHERHQKLIRLSIVVRMNLESNEGQPLRFDPPIPDRLIILAMPPIRMVRDVVPKSTGAARASGN
jgi:hypothetical protein